MIKIVISPKDRQNIYGLLTRKELSLRQKNRGTFFRSGAKKAGEDKWVHRQYNGWIRLQKCLGGTCVVLVQAKNSDEEWQMLSAFIGFLDRHGRNSISNINITYESATENSDGH